MTFHWDRFFAMVGAYIAIPIIGYAVVMTGRYLIRLPYGEWIPIVGLCLVMASCVALL